MSDIAPIRTGIIGFGLSGRVFHAPFIATDPAFSLELIATGDPGRQADARERHPGAELVSTPAELLARAGDLDLVVLTGPSFALAGSLYLPAVESLLGTAFFARQSHAVRVTISTNASDSAAVGAAALVLQSELAPRQSGARMQAELGPEPIPVQGRTSVVGSVG